MKKNILLLAFCVLSLIGYASSECMTIRIVCESGGGTNLISCGSDAEVARDVKAVISELCN